jgi:hypothetical protein
MKLFSLVLVFSLTATGFVSAQQQVLLDFSGTSGSVVYTTQMKNDIQSLMETIYQDFNVTFFQSTPSSGPFSRLTFNQGSPGGLASGIDFRNLNKSDSAVINVSGLGFSSTADLVGLSANIGSHELGHLLGLRHRDGFGPIGSGVFSGLGGNFLPAYPGPSNATEFGDHVMSTPAFGASVPRFTQPVWFSERSAIKLAAIDQLVVTSEAAGNNNSVGTAQSLTLGKMLVPNTILSGQNSGLGPLFDVDAISVTGSITAGDVDFYSFEGNAGDLFNFEVMSSALNRIPNPFDTTLTIVDSNGIALDYYGSPAFNDDEIETTDSTIIDLFLQQSGTFFVRVAGFSGSSSGGYELFFSRFNGAAQAVPEPAAVSFLCLAFTGMLLCRRRVA